MTADEQAVEWVQKAMDRILDDIAADLRRLADAVERKKGPAVDPMSTAQFVLSDVTNMLPNLNLGGLVRAAHDVVVIRDGTR